MPLFLLPTLPIFFILPFVPIEIRVIYGEEAKITIEIQPFQLVLTQKKQDGKKHERNRSRIKEILFLIKLALPYSMIVLSEIDFFFQESDVFLRYRNRAFLGASLYPLIAYAGSISKNLTICKSAASSPTSNNQSNIFIDISFNLRLYSVILIIAKYFLSKQRRNNRARRDEGTD